MKDSALTLLRIAAALFPPLAALLERALDELSPVASVEEYRLADEVRSVLPVKSRSREAIEALEKDRTL